MRAEIAKFRREIGRGRGRIEDEWGREVW